MQTPLQLSRGGESGFTLNQLPLQYLSLGSKLLDSVANPFYVPDGPGFFVASYRPAPRMLLLGSAHGVAALAGVGSLLGYHVTVCDPRPVFTTQQRFPAAAEVVVRWPDEYLRDEAAAGRLDARTVLCVLTHDLKTALPALDVALRLPVGYIGVMGSRHSQRDLRDRLLAAGHDAGALERLAAPIGLDLGAVDSAEMAVSVAAEIVTMVRGGTGQRLSALRGPIHAAPAPMGQPSHDANPSKAHQAAPGTQLSLQNLTRPERMEIASHCLFLGEVARYDSAPGIR